MLQSPRWTPASQAWAPPGLIRLDYRSGVDGLADWALVHPGRPAGDATSPITWLVVLHGHGSQGDQLYTRPDLRDDWLRWVIEQNQGVLTPNLRGNAWMSPAAVADLTAMLDEVRHRYGVTRFILASGSMGGTGSLIYACQKPADVAGVVALCPATDLPGFHRHLTGLPDKPVAKQIHDAIAHHYEGSSSLMARHSVMVHAAALTMPVYLAHGSADPLIPVEQSRQLAAVLRGEGRLCQYVEQPGGGHDAPLPLWRQGVQWVLGQLSTSPAGA